MISFNFFIVVVAGGGLVTLGLLGSTLALVNAGANAPSNRRSSYDDYYYDNYDRQDAIAQGNAIYAQNVRNFEEKTFRTAARKALRGLRNMRHSSRRFGKALRRGAKAMGRNTLQGVQAVARSTGRMAKRYFMLCVISSNANKDYFLNRHRCLLITFCFELILVLEKVCMRWPRRQERG